MRPSLAGAVGGDGNGGDAGVGDGEVGADAVISALASASLHGVDFIDFFGLAMPPGGLGVTSARHAGVGLPRLDFHQPTTGELTSIRTEGAVERA